MKDDAAGVEKKRSRHQGALQQDIRGLQRSEWTEAT